MPINIISTDQFQGALTVAANPQHTAFTTPEYTLYNQFMGVIFPSLAAANAATYAQAGNVLTVTCTGHNIPATVHNGKSIYLTPGTASTGVQLPQGLFTNFLYVDANTFTCVSNINQASGTGPLNTQTSAITIPNFSVTVPGGMLGLNGFIDCYNFSQCNATAGTKRISFLLGTLSFKNPSPNSTSVCVQENHRIQNVNSLLKQMALAVGLTGNSGANLATAPILGTVDTSITQQITASVTLSAALDFITLEHVVITLTQG